MRTEKVEMSGASASFFSSEKDEPEYCAGWLIALSTSRSFRQEYLVRLDPSFLIARVASLTLVCWSTALCLRITRCAACLAVEVNTFAICFLVFLISSFATVEMAFLAALRKVSQTASISLASIL